MAERHFGSCLQGPKGRTLWQPDQAVRLFSKDKGGEKPTQFPSWKCIFLIKITFSLFRNIIYLNYRLLYVLFI